MWTVIMLGNVFLMHKMRQEVINHSLFLVVNSYSRKNVQLHCSRNATVH